MNQSKRKAPQERGFVVVSSHSIATNYGVKTTKSYCIIEKPHLAVRLVKEGLITARFVIVS